MKLQPNEFSSYDLTQLETAKGWTVGPETQAVLRNEQSKIAEEILSLRVEGKDKEEEERKTLAYKQGQLHMLQTILANIAMFSQDLDLMIQEEDLQDN